MKKSVILTLTLVFLMVFGILTAAEAANSPGVFIDGKQLVTQNPVVIENGKTLVPLRAIFEALNQQVNWNAADQTITSGNVWLQINNSTAKVGDKKITLDVPAKILQGGTYVPLRFIAESLSKDVQWDGKQNRIDIKNTTDTTDTTAPQTSTEPATPAPAAANPELNFELTEVYYEDDVLKAKGTFTNTGDVFITKILSMDIKLFLANDAGESEEVTNSTFEDLPVNLEPGASTEYELIFTDVPVYTDATQWWAEEYNGEFEYLKN